MVATEHGSATRDGRAIALARGRGQERGPTRIEDVCERLGSEGPARETVSGFPVGGELTGAFKTTRRASERTATSHR